MKMSQSPFSLVKRSTSLAAGILDILNRESIPVVIPNIFYWESILSCFEWIPANNLPE